MKYILSLFFIAGLLLSANAQQLDSKYKVSLGGELLSAFGSTAEFYGMGYGGSLQAEYSLSSKLNVTLSGGYVSVEVSKRYKDIFTPWGYVPKNTVVYPAKAGLKYNFYKKYYAAAEGGMAISKDKGVRGNSFAYAGGVGTNFEISNKTSIDVGLRFEEWAVSSTDRLSFVGLRAAYVFGF
ncbi:hypothetical protein WG904_17045 [Pedobacter sp. Du54]|uniref:hypothetical protein n=1 Tax=Pedobacter anseongensis TaxID=3133439 RepID=UPI00309FE306